MARDPYQNMVMPVDIWTSLPKISLSRELEKIEEKFNDSLLFRFVCLCFEYTLSSCKKITSLSINYQVMKHPVTTFLLSVLFILQAILSQRYSEFTEKEKSNHLPIFSLSTRKDFHFPSSLLYVLVKSILFV